MMMIAKAKQSKWRLMLRTALFAGNIIALVLLIQDASKQQYSYSADDDRPNINRKAMTRRSGGGGIGLHRRPRSLAEKYRQRQKSLQQKQRQKQQDEQLLPGHVPHPMMKGPLQDKKRPRKGKKKKNTAGGGGKDNNELPPNPPNFTHYFIHIPKAGGTYARHQLNSDMRENRLVRKRGILCDNGISPVSNYKNWPTYFEFQTKGWNRTATAKAAAQYLHGEGYVVPPPAKKTVRQKCGLYMTESHWSSIPDHVYTIVRDPREHTVSAYFHCKESKHHGKKYGHLMPDTLDEWLNAWTNVRQADGLQKAKAMEKTETFRCYNPINMQSSMLLAASEKKGEKAEISKASLAKRFDVMGLTSQMDKSLCLVFIAWNGFAPDRCICGGEGDNERKVQGGSSPNAADDDSADQRLTHNVAIHSHNVTNHGGTHKHTPEQLSAIEALADVDMKLYAVAEELFEDQVAAVEKKYSIKLC